MYVGLVMYVIIYIICIIPIQYCVDCKYCTVRYGSVRYSTFYYCAYCMFYADFATDSLFFASNGDSGGSIRL